MKTFTIDMTSNGKADKYFATKGTISEINNNHYI